MNENNNIAYDIIHVFVINFANDNYKCLKNQVQTQGMQVNGRTAVNLVSWEQQMIVFTTCMHKYLYAKT